MEKLKFADLPDSESRILMSHFAKRSIKEGAVQLFKPGERLALAPGHDALDLVFLVLQGFGSVPSGGKSGGIETGDTVILEAGDERTVVSSEEDPLVLAWYVMEPVDQANFLDN